MWLLFLMNQVGIQISSDIHHTLFFFPQAEHKKSYENEIEEKFRMKIFQENKHIIAKHNQRYSQGLVSYKLGINKYADMLHHEFVNTLNGYNRSMK